MKTKESHLFPVLRLSWGHNSPADFNPPFSTTPATTQQALLCNKLDTAGRRSTNFCVETCTNCISWVLFFNWKGHFWVLVVHWWKKQNMKQEALQDTPHQEKPYFKYLSDFCGAVDLSQTWQQQMCVLSKVTFLTHMPNQWEYSILLSTVDTGLISKCIGLVLYLLRDVFTCLVLLKRQWSL